MDRFYFYKNVIVIELYLLSKKKETNFCDFFLMSSALARDETSINIGF